MRRAVLTALALLIAMPVAVVRAAPEDESVHVVLAGETLGGVAARAKVPRVLIAEANGLRAPYALRAGQRLRIPRTRRHTVAEGETGFAIGYQYGVAWRAIATANGLTPDTAVKPGQELLIPTVLAPTRSAAASARAASPAAIAATTTATTARPSISVADEPPAQFAWPVSGPVRRTFAPRGRSGYHDGIDIRSTEGTAVRASAAGRVIFAGQGPREYGQTVILHHGQRWTTVYGFLSRITVKEGDRVKAGERIGMIGHTGLARGDELHFEVRRSREALNPASYLPARD